MTPETIKALCPEFAELIDYCFESYMTERDNPAYIRLLKALAESRQALEWRPIDAFDNIFSITEKGESFLTDGKSRWGIRWDRLTDEFEFFDLPGFDVPKPTHYFIVPALPTPPSVKEGL